MLPLPSPATDELRLADWLELNALISKDRNASKGDLERALRRGGILEDQGQEAVDEKCLEVFAELEARAAAAQDSYPFRIDGGLLALRSNLEDFPAYIFCLCLSSLRWKQRKGTKIFPRRMFETLSHIAAKAYLGGDALLFASPRQTLPKSFKKALTEVCTRIAEGGGYRQQEAPDPKDDTVDLIAWKAFPDRRPGKLLLFGQCTSGRDLRAKRSELQSSAFCQQWMLSQPVSPLINAFFIPHRVAQRNWEAISRRAGIVFDRCRLSLLVHNNSAAPNMRQYLSWSKQMLRITQA